MWGHCVVTQKSWSVSKQRFNQMYRERRLAAERAGRKFPSYAAACRQLETAVRLAELRGEVASINEFWDFVFSVRPSS
jgi:hypothetical protein